MTTDVLCAARTGPVWKAGGEICVCGEPRGHDSDPTSWHKCSCGAWWVDDSMIARAQAGRAGHA